MARVGVVCYGLTGGTTGTLDSINSADLTSNSIAFTVTATALYCHRYDETSSAAESSPDVIMPDDLAGSGRWLLLALNITKGAANAKLFMNAAGALPEWDSGVKTGSFTRDIAGANGNVAYTGAGFKPSAIIFIGAVSNTKYGSVGFTSSVSSGMLFSYAGTGNWGIGTGNCISFHSGSGGESAALSSLDADGFTLTWAKTGDALTGTATIIYLAFR